MSNTTEQNITMVDGAALSSSSSATLNYTGKVKISFCNGSKVFKSKTYSNNGCGPLFKFIAQCLQGEYKQAEKTRPTKVKLFYNTATSPVVNWHDSSIRVATNFITSNAPADIAVIKDYTTGQISGYKTILHFLIPAVFVDTSSVNDTFEINQICLYPAKEFTDENCSAYFLFTETDEEGTVTWAGLSTEDLVENMNILIDWEMSITNAGGNK